MSSQVRALHADITTLSVDAVVNAANSTLLGGGGVDGAIHDAAGPALLEECRAIGGCPPGEARITGAHRLPAKRIIHTVGPIWQGGRSRESEVLASCYRASIELAAANDLRTIAFPCISTGAYGFPPDLAAPIAVSTVKGVVAALGTIDEVIFCCFSAHELELYRRLLRAARQ